MYFSHALIGLVAGELERRWNERLVVVARLEEHIQSLQNEQPRALCDDERAMLLALADDLPQLWNHPAASTETRKRILPAVLHEIIVTVAADRLCLVLHWQGTGQKIAGRPMSRPCN
jgi:hypothetical protein